MQKEIIYDADGTPVYDARVLASFKSGTVENYQNFRDAFEKAYASMVWIFHYLAGRRMGRKNLQPSQLKQ